MELKVLGLKIIIKENVYAPAEDSLMLVDAIKGTGGQVLEMGCGCGIVSLVCAKTAKKVIGVDINPEAVECAKENAKKNNIQNVEFIESDLFSEVEGTFSTILFNPPYLPTVKKEIIDGALNHAFDGGKDGRKVLDCFLDKFSSHLDHGGELFLVQSSLNDLEETTKKLEERGFSVSIVEEKSFFFEKLYVLKAERYI